MKTEDLIRALVADGARPNTPLDRHLMTGLLGGTALAMALFLVILRARPDLNDAIHSLAFVYKLIVITSLAVTAAALLPEIARPQPTSARFGSILLVAPALLVTGVSIELLLQPPSLWLARLVGHNARHCLSLIPILSVAPAVCLLIALRKGAPQNPTAAGAVVGLVSGGFGALLYGLTCPDDSPLFVSTWYTLAIAVVTGATALVGRRLLRW